MNELMEKLKHVIQTYGVNSIEAYDISLRLAIETDKVYNNKTVQSYYNDSITALTKYIEINKHNPTECKWDKYVQDKCYLSSHSMGYMYGRGFNKLCKKISKEKKFKMDI